MANYKTGAQRYNDMKDKIFARAKQLEGPFYGRSNLSPSEIKAHKKHVNGVLKSEARNKAIHAKAK